jgi:outer membrane lipoprotein LolB
MRFLARLAIVSALLSGCVTNNIALKPRTWEERVAQLQRAPQWHLQGRAAAATGTQGWQASLDWLQQSQTAQIGIAGPLGVGAVSLILTPDGLQAAGSASRADAATLIEQRLGFTAPLDHLRYWLLGVPDPRAPVELLRNAEDRAQQLVQDGWTVDYERYVQAGSDLLPERLTLHRDTVRVRIVVERWDPAP